LNVACGGSLHPRLHEVPGRMDHRETASDTLEGFYRDVHEVDVSPDGLLAGICRNSRIGLRHMVNSLHQQGIDRLAEGVVVEALAEDATVEAVSVPDAGVFCMALQWHPEWGHDTHPLNKAIFDNFAEAARKRRRERSL